VDAIAVAPVHGHARRLGVEAHDLALVRRAAGPARAPEVQRLEQVRLAGAVGAVQHRQPGTERDVGRRVGAEVAHAQAGDEHGRGRGRAGGLPQMLRRIGMIR
jgi:hypothetical protein